MRPCQSVPANRGREGGGGALGGREWIEARARGAGAADSSESARGEGLLGAGTFRRSGTRAQSVVASDLGMGIAEFPVIFQPQNQFPRVPRMRHHAPLLQKCATPKPLRCLAFSRSPRFGVAFGQNGVASGRFQRRFEPKTDARMRHVTHSPSIEHFGHLQKFLGPSENSADRHRRAGRAPRLAVSCRQHRAFESHPLRQSRHSGHSFSCARPRPPDAGICGLSSEPRELA